MGEILIIYEPRQSETKYATRFRPSSHAIEEASTYSSTFEGCLDFILEQFNTRAPIGVVMSRYELNVEGELPPTQYRALQRLMAMYNDGFTLACRLADPKERQRIAENLGQTPVKHRSTLRK
jgi:hypothetical protein